MWAAWAFAIFWNAISAVTPFIAYREVVDNQNYAALLALVFPLVFPYLVEAPHMRRSMQEGQRRRW